MSTHVIERGAHVHAHLATTARRHVAWLIGSFALGFLVPFVFAEILDLPRDLFYGVYVVSVVAFFVLWAKTTGQQLGTMIRRRWRLAVALGLVAAALLAVIVVQKDSTARPEGLELVGALLWRGSSMERLTVCSCPYSRSSLSSQSLKGRGRDNGSSERSPLVWRRFSPRWS